MEWRRDEERGMRARSGCEKKRKMVNSTAEDGRRTIKGRASSHRRVADLFLTLAVGLKCAAAVSDLVTTLAIRPQPSFYYLVRAGNEPVELKQVEINERTLSGCRADGGLTDEAGSVEKSRTVIGKTKEKQLRTVSNSCEGQHLRDCEIKYVQLVCEDTMPGSNVRHTRIIEVVIKFTFQIDRQQINCLSLRSSYNEF